MAVGAVAWGESRGVRGRFKTEVVAGFLIELTFGMSIVVVSFTQ